MTPPFASSMPWHVTEVRPLGGYRLRVRFQDGLSGEVDMSGFVRSPNAGVFASLADPALFAQAYISRGAVAWPGDLDLAPDAMHREIRKSGRWALN
jgi:hypothetical protein